MSERAHGAVDYRGGEFAVSCPYDAAVVAELKHVQRRRWESDAKLWLIAHHHPSAAALLGLARKHGWSVSDVAWRAFRQLQDDADATELSVDVVQGNGGEPWFFCMLGDDDDLQRRVLAIPGAYIDAPDESAWVPAYRVDCAEQLRAIIETDTRLCVSSAAVRLLDEPEEWFEPAACDEGSGLTLDGVDTGLTRGQ